MTSPITTKACEAWWLLEAADLRGLPAPYDVDVTAERISIGVRTRAELDRWAEALAAEVTSQLVGSRTHWHTSGELHSLPVHVFAVTAMEAVS